MGALIHGASDLGPVSLSLPPPFMCAACSSRMPMPAAVWGGDLWQVRPRAGGASAWALVKETNHADQL